MKWLYLFLNIGSFSLPFLYSFNKDMRFIKRFKDLMISIPLTGLMFIIWDIWFTHIGIWGFNSTYHLGFTILNMPLEEWLFFFCIPYACLFTHYAIQHFKMNWVLPTRLTKNITIGLIALSIGVAAFNTDKLYTLVNFTILALVLIAGLIYKLDILKRFYISFVFILLPFLLVNGMLTGSFIQQEVVWYNHTENLNIKNIYYSYRRRWLCL